MKTYNLYKNPKLNIVEAIKDGFSWPGLFFNFFWMLFKGLWGHAGMYMALTILLSSLNRISPIAAAEPFATLIFIVGMSMPLIPGVWGNKWREKRFNREGYEYIASIKAESPKAAIEQLSPKFVEILSSSNHSDIMIASSILEAEGVPYEVVGGALNSGGLPSVPAKIFVPTEQKEKALLFLRQVEELG